MAAFSCGCGADAKLIFSCSGASEVGDIADRAGRRLSKDGAGKMFCLAGIGAGISGFIASAQGACKVLVIDSCPVDCARKCVEKAGVKNLTHLRIADLSLEKGKSPANNENVGKSYEAAKKLL
ncbi:MAG TPA: putative zinc-binding protein [Elusimicrobiales bacterium]|nr:putative zinc-binding protein [Elusimicrobiales bacterium]